MATYDHSRTAPGQTRTPAELAADRNLSGVWLIRDHLAGLRRPSGPRPPRPGGRHRPHEFARNPEHGRCVICALPRRNAIHVTAAVPADE